MPGEVKKPLYIGSSIEELNKKIDVNIAKGQTSKLYARSAGRVFDEAERAYNAALKDEERAYVLFMKYAGLFQAARKCRDYKQNKDFVDALINDQKFLDAIERAEKLSASLHERYDELEEAKVASKKLEEEKGRAKAQTDNADKEEDKTSTENGTEEEDEPPSKRVLGAAGVVSSMELYKEIDSNSNSVLLLDVRRSDHFRDSHMTIGQVVSVPEEVLKPGLSAAALEKGLGEEAKAFWKQRADMEFIVLVDWEENTQKESSLSIVRDTMCKWDWGMTYMNEPLRLKGGYEDWLFRFPMYTSDPKAKKPVKAVEQSKNLLNFDYPDLDDEDDKPPPPRLPPPDANASPSSANSQQPPSPSSNGSASQNRMFYISAQPSSQKPTIDRTVKPGTSKPDPGLPNAIQTDSRRNGPPPMAAPKERTTTASDLGGKSSNGGSTRPPHGLEPSSNGPVSNNSKRVVQSMPTVDRNLKPKLGEASARDSTPTVDSDVLKHGNEKDQVKDGPNQTRDQEMESQGEDTSKADAQQEELKRKAELARQDLDKMRYSRTKAENEKLREEKAEMERNMLKLQQQLKESKTRQESKKANSKPTSPTHPPSSPTKLAPKSELDNSSKDSTDSRTEHAKAETPNQSPVHKPSSKPDTGAQGTQYQPNQNSNARTGEAKSSVQASPSKGSASATAKATDLPNGWEKRWDEKSKRYFYLNHKLNTTQWDPPGQNTQRPQAAEAKSAGANATLSSKALDNARTSTSKPGEVTRRPLKSDSSEPSSQSGGLKRSFSSPNIAQMFMNEEGENNLNNLTKPLPSVDRTTKPAERPPQQIIQPRSLSQSRVRNLNPIFGNQGRSLTGLRNLGNTCFMNSVIQCLSNTTPLAKYFIMDHYLTGINRENPLGRKGEVAEEFAVVVKALWSGQYRSIAPRDLRDTVTKYVPEFRKHVGHHHDSQEFLLFLMDGLHEDLNEARLKGGCGGCSSTPLHLQSDQNEEEKEEGREVEKEEKVKKREYIKEEDFSKYRDVDAASLSWKNHEKLNRSIIVSLFQGQFKSTVECLSCHNKSVKFEAFMYLSLPIPSNSRCSLYDCLAKFSQPEKLSGDNATHCSQCKAHRNSKKTIQIWKLPRILLIHLKRFYYEGMWRQKLQTFVDFPAREELNMEKYVIGPQPNQRHSYRLYSVSNHTGTLDGGHYTACCKNSINDRWYKYDDHEVYDAPQNNIRSSGAYILFYSSIPLTPP